jgi:hypothetical protein
MTTTLAVERVPTWRWSPTLLLRASAVSFGGSGCCTINQSDGGAMRNRRGFAAFLAALLLLLLLYDSTPF